MRGNIELWINDVLVDLDDETIILFNYSIEDLSNPAIVKNSYTQSVVLQGTPTNNMVFTHIYRMDSRSASGFLPHQRAPFRIVKDGELLEQGYVKLDKVSRENGKLTYNLTLYGGLGSFFYALSYREDGEKKTLADLDFLGNGEKISYSLYASEVREAWDALSTTYDRSNKWHHLNFSPCYNGIPSDGFSADKAVMVPANAPYPENMTNQSGAQCQPTNFVQLSQEYDEWATKDLRAYMQRPVVRVRSIFEAIADSTQNGGFNVNLDSAFFYERNPYFNETWLTRPMLNTLEGGESQGTFTIGIPSTPQITPSTGTATVKLSTSIRTEGNMTIEGMVNANIHITLQDATGLEAGDILDLRDYYDEYPTFTYTLVVKSFDGNVVLEKRSDSPATFQYVWNGKEAICSAPLQISLDPVTNVGRLEIVGYMRGDFTLRSTTNQAETYNISTIYLEEASSAMIYEGKSSARTGTIISQDDILKTAGTPADYILSYAKMFGLQFVYDKFTNTINIMLRNNLYNGDTLDIESRIDRSKKIEVKPFVFDTKFYDFNVENVEGAYADYYQSTYGRDYGLHRLNTGYDFDAANKKVMDSVIFKGTAQVLARGRYFNRIAQSSTEIPSVFLDAGHKVTYVNVNNASDTFDYDIPSVNRSADILYLNQTYLSYDRVDRPQFCDMENAPIEGEDVMLLYRRDVEYYATITDDDVAMFATHNDGTPCWILSAPTSTIPVPHFSRYRGSSSRIEVSLDFGIPAEIDIPGITHANGATVYERGWNKYLADRYNVDTKVVTCNVDWRGIQVNESLLRNFYYFDGAIWVLNKITNHDIAGFGTTQCEFVKVQSRVNYIYGQDYDI